MSLAKWIIISFIFLPACFVSMSEREKCENILPPPVIPCSTNEALESSHFAMGNWPKKGWWEEFHLQDLNILITNALAINPTINEVRARITYAEKLSTISRSRLFPLIYFNASDTWQYLSKNGLYRALNPNIPLNANLIDLTLSFCYEFDFWGKNRNLFYADLDRTLAAFAESKAVELITTTALAQAYFAYKTNLRKKVLYERLNVIREELYALENLRLESSLVSKLTPLLLQESVFNSKKLLLAIEDEIATNRHLINVLAGLGPDCPLNCDTYLPPVSEQLIIPCDLALNLVSRRPDLMAQIWRVEALSHEVGAAKADFYPNINLTSFIGLESIAYSLLFRGSSFTAGVKPALSLPIFTAGAILANVEAKKAEFDQAVFHYNELVLNSVREVADYLSFGKTVYEQKKEQESLVENAKRRYELTRLRLQSGLDNRLALYQFEAFAIEAELDDLNLLYNQYVAAIKLIKALGGGFGCE